MIKNKSSYHIDYIWHANGEKKLMDCDFNIDYDFNMWE
jgi:hypothetical protein